MQICASFQPGQKGYNEEFPSYKNATISGVLCFKGTSDELKPRTQLHIYAARFLFERLLLFAAEEFDPPDSLRL